MVGFNVNTRRRDSRRSRGFDGYRTTDHEGGRWRYIGPAAAGLRLPRRNGCRQDLDKATALFEQAAEAKVEGAGGGLVSVGYAYQSG